MSSARSLPVPLILAPAMVLPALSPVSSTKEMVPAVLLTAVATPSDLAAPTPPGAFHALALPKVHADSAVLLRYLVKLSVVPDSSERCTAWIAEEGSFASGLSALMAA